MQLFRLAAPCVLIAGLVADKIGITHLGEERVKIIWGVLIVLFLIWLAQNITARRMTVLKPFIFWAWILGVVVGVPSYMYYQMHVDLVTVGEVAALILIVPTPLLWIWILPEVTPARQQRMDMIVQILNDHPNDAYSSDALTAKLNEVERARRISPVSRINEVISTSRALVTARRIRYSKERGGVTKR